MSSFTKAFRLSVIGLAVICVGGCQSYQAPSAASPLTGTAWVLIEYRAEAASTATDVPLNRYTLSLEADGTARAKLDCNNGTTRWTSTKGKPGSGSISFGEVAATRALCPEGSLGERLAADLPRMATWSLYDGRLTLATGHEGPEYNWDSID